MKEKIQPALAANGEPGLLSHIRDLVSKDKPTPHSEILAKLIDQFEPIDFKALVFPEAKKLRQQLSNLAEDSDAAKRIRRELDKMRVTRNHYLILSIENVAKIAEENHWSLCKNHDFIYLFNGAYWSNIDKETFQKFLGEAAEKMGVPRFSARWYQFREHLFKQFLATCYLPTPDPNKGTVLINLQNGTFEIEANETNLRQFDRSDFLTYQLPFNYNEEAKAPIFKAYLDKVLPDIDRQKVLAEYIGYVFIKHGSQTLKEEKALILYGHGANGKSVFFEVISALLGNENTSNFSLQSLTNENGYFRAKLANRLVNYASEINGKLESSLFKLLVSGEPVEARLPYGQPFILKQYAKLIFNCNELPKDVEHTNAYFRRFLIIPFDVTIPTEEQDKQLHTKIIEKELSGVFNWVLEGLDRLLKQRRFTNCEAANEAVENYKNQSDSVKLFLDENGYDKSATHHELIKNLYIRYREFCIDDGFRPVSKSKFINRLKGYGIIVCRINIGNIAYLKTPS